MTKSLRRSAATNTGSCNTEGVEILILGAGWTAGFLMPLLQQRGISFAATTTNGRNGTIPFRYDPSSSASEPFEKLPRARTVLVTFPLRGIGPSARLKSLYAATHGGDDDEQQPESAAATATTAGVTAARTMTQWIQLGSSGIYKELGWSSSTSPYDADDPRAQAEDELRSAAGGGSGAVLSLAGLYDNEVRDPRRWAPRVATSKDALRAKSSVHLVHGSDVARAIVGLHEKFTPGRRWLVTDTRVYDWWDLLSSWGPEARRLDAAAAAAREKAGAGAVVPGKGEGEADGLQYELWTAELMLEEGVRALPRGPESLGRALDSRDFWKEVGLWPSMGRVTS